MTKEEGFWNNTKEAAGDAWDKTKTVSENIWEGTKETAGNVWDKTKKVSENIWEGTKDTAGDVKDFIMKEDTKNSSPAKNSKQENASKHHRSDNIPNIMN